MAFQFKFSKLFCHCVILAVGLSLVLFSTTACIADEFTRLERKLAKQSSVLVRTESGQGSGSLIAIDGNKQINGKHLVLTATHVITKSKSIRISYFPFGENDNTTNVKVLVADEKSDVALLQVKIPGLNHRFQTLSVCDDSGFPSAKKKVPVLLSGFPHSSFRFQETTVESRDDFFSWKHPVSANCWFHKRNFGGGGSGSPLLVRINGQLKIIGTYWGTAGTQGVSSTEIHSTLDKTFKKLLKKKEGNTPSPETESPLIQALEQLIKELEKIDSELE